jgi:aquaporin Z
MIKKLSGTKRSVMQHRITYYLSEFIGTFLMIFIGISAIVLNFGTLLMRESIPSYSLRLLFTGILFAGGATMVVYSPVGRVSGAHMNPAVTLAFFLEKKIGIVELLLFSFMQILGSTIASFLVLLIWSDNARKVNVGMTLPGKGYSIGFVFLIEVFISFLLISLIFYFLHAQKLTKYTGIAVGLLVAILVFLTAPISGTSLNPARSIGPAFVSWNFSFLWLYITAPLLGSFIAVIIRKKITFLHSPLCAKLNHSEKDDKCLYNCRYVGR